MTRWKLTIEYDGAPFSGWQRQKNGPSVQGALEAAITGVTGETVTVFGAGRTDAGVHATGQVAHADIEKPFRPSRLVDAINAHLRPQPVAVLSAEEAAESFDARFSARRRLYLYRIVNRRAPPVLEQGRVWHVGRRLDAEAMHRAAQRLVGRHDFSTFRASLCQARSPVKTLDRLEVARDGEEIRIDAAARSFLHHQVRNMVGTLELIGAGKWSEDDLAEALAARDRRRGGPTAPAHGLTLTGVVYPAD